MDVGEQWPTATQICTISDQQKLIDVSHPTATVQEKANQGSSSANTAVMMPCMIVHEVLVLQR
eukprot:2425673-Pleurochrysis_carterae.AAC.2